MPFTSTTSTTTFVTPHEAPEALAALVALIDGAQASLLLVMYGFTDQALVDALCRAYLRGVPVRCIFDHTQASGPTEVGMLHRLMLTVPALNIRIGTSPVKRQLIHLKCLVVDSLTCASGSLNWSPSGFQQINNLDVVASPERAAAFTSVFETEWAWLSVNEPSYQPAPVMAMSPSVVAVIATTP